jgi:hypothetical protein
MMKVLLKSNEDLIKAGFEITHVSDCGSYMRFRKKDGGVEMGMWTNIQHEPHLVVDYDTIRKEDIDLFPDAFIEVQG